MTPQDANRELLINFLRDPEAQAKSHFRWDFSWVLAPQGSCGSIGCAIGAAVHLGIVGRVGRFDMEEIAAALGLPTEEAGNIFFDCRHYGYSLSHSISAEMVADAIEDAARQQKERNARRLGPRERPTAI